MRLPRNMSRLDRGIRFLFGLVLLFIAGTFDLDLVIAVLVGAFGVINVFSALASHCPVYGAIGISSCPKATDDPSQSGVTPPAK